jgi:hypothetical protein
MEGVWRDSDVGRTSIWYCSTYKGEDATPKCIFLTTYLPWFYPQMRKPPRKFPPGHSCRIALARSLSHRKQRSAARTAVWSEQGRPEKSSTLGGCLGGAMQAG